MIPGRGIILIIMARRVQIVAADGAVGGHRHEVVAKGNKNDNNTLAKDHKWTKDLTK